LPGKLDTKNTMDMSQGKLLDVDKEILTVDTKLVFKSLKFDKFKKNPVNN